MTRTVQRIRRVRVGTNAAGQPIYQTTTADVTVYGWQPVSEVERNSAALAGRTITDLQLLVPNPGDWRADDQAVLDGTTYDVDGQPASYNTGPFSYRPGGVVNLRAVSNG